MAEQFVTVPGFLSKVEFVSLRLTLEFQQEDLLPPGYALHLRRELQRLVRQLPDRERFGGLLAPSLPTDPLLLRSWQRPSPCFALHPPLSLQSTRVEPGDELELPVVVLGRGVALVPELLELFDVLGASGLCHGRGVYEMTRVSCRGSDGGERVLWRRGERLGDVAPTLVEAGWWLQQSAPADGCRLSWDTPARLVHQGKPLFRASFHALLPFLVRRVGGALSYWCAVEGRLDPQRLLDAGARVEETAVSLRWLDWRALEGSEGLQPLGGLSGALQLRGPGLGELHWLLVLGSLLNLGKGAAYGRGQYRLEWLQGPAGELQRTERRSII